MRSERTLKLRQGKHSATPSLVLQTPKVPEVTLAFRVIKVAATTLGETGGDTLSMTMNLGYALSSIVFFTLFLVAVAVQLASKSFHPFLYWLVVVVDDDCPHDHGGLCGSLAGHRLLRRFACAFDGIDGRSRVVAVLARLRVGQPDRLAQGRRILLGDNPLFEHARHCSGRLFRR